ncbi:glycosyltransferase family 2 protein [Pseudomonadota bacterium]
MYSPSTTDSPTAPLVSILIPCYNAASFVGAAIDSAYRQTYATIEVIVVDDGSTDESLGVVKRLHEEKYPHLTLLTHPDGANCGVSTSRYRAFTAASGKYVAFLDADDCFEPKKIEKQVALMEKAPDIVLCHTGVVIFGDGSYAEACEENLSIQPTDPYFFRSCSDYLTRNRICNSTVIVRADILRKVPFAMPQLFQYEDWLCWSLVSAYGKFQYIDENLTRYRVHNDSATASAARSPLGIQYSLLELKLALAVRSESFWHCIKCLSSAGLTISVLLRQYCAVPQDSPSFSTLPFNRIFRFLRWLVRGSRRAVSRIGWPARLNW